VAKSTRLCLTVHLLYDVGKGKCNLRLVLYMCVLLCCASMLCCAVLLQSIRGKYLILIYQDQLVSHDT
jgi:hypothetical protein